MLESHMPDPSLFWESINGFQRSAAIRAAVDLDVDDQLAHHFGQAVVDGCGHAVGHAGNTRGLVLVLTLGRLNVERVRGRNALFFHQSEQSAGLGMQHWRFVLSLSKGHSMRARRHAFMLSA